MPIFSATMARLLFFGGRYVSLLLVARQLGEKATAFLLAVAIVEVCRIVFDYGLENSILGRSHQKNDHSGSVFAEGERFFRLYTILGGQLVTSAIVGILCVKDGDSLVLPLLTSLQFSCLMGFGYLQAHLQTGRPGAMAALVLPLTVASAFQAILLWLSYSSFISLLWCVMCFELIALVGCSLVGRHFIDFNQRMHQAKKGLSSSKAILFKIAPLGNVALLGIAYNRLDSFAMPLVAGGSLLAQYLVYQRLASAPLMFFSTIASSTISTLSADPLELGNSSRKIALYRLFAYLSAFLSATALMAFTPLIMRFFAIHEIDSSLLFTQALILAFQIANGFHSSLLIAHGKIAVLWRMSQRNAIAALLLLPSAAWIGSGVAVAIALCLVEAFCALQHVLEFRSKQKISKNVHA